MSDHSDSDYDMGEEDQQAFANATHGLTFMVSSLLYLWITTILNLTFDQDGPQYDHELDDHVPASPNTPAATPLSSRDPPATTCPVITTTDTRNSLKRSKRITDYRLSRVRLRTSNDAFRVYTPTKTLRRKNISILKTCTGASYPAAPRLLSTIRLYEFPGKYRINAS